MPPGGPPVPECSFTLEPIHPDPGPPRSWIVRLHAGAGAAPGADQFGTCVVVSRPGEPQAVDVKSLVFLPGRVYQTAVHRALRDACRRLGFRRAYYERWENGALKYSRVVEL